MVRKEEMYATSVDHEYVKRKLTTDQYEEREDIKMELYYHSCFASDCS